LKDNALFVFSFGALAIWSARFVWKKARNQQPAIHLPPKMLWILLAVAFVFTILRNLPAFSFLSP